MQYDLVVIGNSPAGQEAALAAAKMNKCVAIVEREPRSPKGMRLHTGMIPSKILREAVRNLSGERSCDVYGESSCRKRQITMDDLRREIAQAQQRELALIQDQFDRNGIDVIVGDGRFVDSHTVEVVGPQGRTVLESVNVLVASGTKPARPGRIPFDGQQVFDSNDLLTMPRVPRSLIVVGGDAIGIEYAILFAALGVEVTLVDGCGRHLESSAREVVDRLLDHARSLSLTFRLGANVIGIDAVGDERVVVHLEDGQRIAAETVLYNIGRVGNTDGLNLPAAGLQADERGRVWCNEDQQTWMPHIYAAGDVVGFPSLACASTGQGFRTVGHMFGKPFGTFRQMPGETFTIPAGSRVGRSGEQLTVEKPITPRRAADRLSRVNRREAVPAISSGTP